MRKLLLPLAIAMLAVAACGGTSHTRTVTVPKVAKAAPVAIAPITPEIAGGRERAPGFGQPPVGDFGLSKNRSLGIAPVLQGYDAVDALAVPLGAPVGGCYVAGGYANCTAMAQRAKRILGIAEWDTQPARIYDLEPGNGIPSDAGPWLRLDYANGVTRPGIYADGSWMPAVQQSAAAYGFPHCTSLSQTHCVLYWLADWDGDPQIPYGYDGKQYASLPQVDLDSFSSAWFVTAKPKPPSMSGTANAHAGRNVPYWYYGIHGTKGTWHAGSQDYFASAEVFIGHDANVYVRPLKRNNSAIAGKGNYWTGVAKPSTNFGLHFNATTGGWKVWKLPGTKPNFTRQAEFLRVIVGFQVKTGQWRMHRDGWVTRIP